MLGVALIATSCGNKGNQTKELSDELSGAGATFPLPFYNVVFEKYLEEMTKSYVSLDYKFGNQDYGYLWWLPHRESDMIAAIGDGGNVIYINKNQNIVVSVTGYFKPMIFDRVEFIEKNVVEALIK